MFTDSKVRKDCFFHANGFFACGAETYKARLFNATISLTMDKECVGLVEGNVSVEETLSRGQDVSVDTGRNVSIIDGVAHYGSWVVSVFKRTSSSVKAAVSVADNVLC